MTSAPAKLRETGPARTLRRHINMLWDYVRECRPIPGPNVRVSRTGVGAVISAVGGKAETVETGVSISQYIVKEIGNDWLRCRMFDGTSESTDDTYVAKAYELRRTPWDNQTVTYVVEDYGTSITTRNVNITYSYKSATYRIATISATGAIENQVVIPRWIVNKTLVYVVDVKSGMSVQNPSGTSIGKIDLNVGARAWGKVV